MKNFRYVDMDSPVEMLLEMFRMLSTEDALAALDKMIIMAYDKKLEATNFSEIVYNEETDAKSYIELISCANCKSNNICKNGKDRNNVQRYLCKQCGHTFSATSNTLSSYTNQSVGKWMVFILGLFNCESCETLSKKCGVSVPTAHSWRLKVFAALEYLTKDIKLSKVIMADDTRLPYSFKGNHGEKFYAPRNSHKRGHQNTTKNMHDNTVCILCAIDSSGHSFSRYIGFGNPSGKRISEGFKDKLNITEDTVLVTDGARCFSEAVNDYSIPFWERKVSIKRGKKKFPDVVGELHIQAVNSYHARLKLFLSRFRGVASRYLPGYIMLFDYMENNKYIPKEDIAKNILDAMTKISIDITIEELEAKFRTPVSNGPETELWEKIVPQKEQKIYIDWYNKVPIKEICEKHKTSRRKVYYIKEKVEKYNLHDKIVSSKKQRKVRSPIPISDKCWEIFLKCYRDGNSCADVAQEYGVSRQYVHQTVNNILKRPESSTVKKFTKKVYQKRKKLRDTSVYRDFKLMYTPDAQVKSVCNVLSSMHGKSSGTIKNHIASYRSKDNLIKTGYQWKEERKVMTHSEYKDFLEKRNNQIYNEICLLINKRNNISKRKIFEIVATKYNISISWVTAIYYGLRDPINNYSTFEKRIFVCDCVNTAKKWYPHLSRKEQINLVAHYLRGSYSTVETIFYKYKKLTQQEQNRESEPTDEVV